MDYEKAYKEALFAMRQRMDAGIIERCYAEAIFPELRESEDERVIKGLENFLWCIANGGMNDRGTMPSAEMCQKWLAYLEKQKEQKPTEWSEEDDKYRNGIIRNLEYLINMTAEGWVTRELRKRIEWLKSLRPQPKQEWSGVDDLRLNQTINVCDRNGYPTLSKWLKGLLYRITPQSSCNPAWRIWRNGACGNSEGNPIALVKESCGYKLVSHLCADGEKYIMLSDLEKLPGFNEK